MNRKTVTLYRVVVDRLTGRPKFHEIECVEKPKTYALVPGQDTRGLGYLSRIGKDDPRFKLDKAAAVADFVERSRAHADRARAEADNAAKRYGEAIAFATAEGIFVEGHSTPVDRLKLIDVPGSGADRESRRAYYADDDDPDRNGFRFAPI